ncbi:LamG-like jellyroll fold domain-containing protein [Candidatus Uabimicrobium sp. HlEnr_7]|uniref:Tc toxin subunit A-related protein n=1 Tax=Candidatus Uabimicrobium helgolandensis TaxID=3095367 RepID=UPI003556E478
MSPSQSKTPFENKISSYHTLFPSPGSKISAKSPSVLSPEAYFVDLMRLIDQYIDQSEVAEGLSLNDRRSDLWQIKLDQQETYTEIPYIEIVNQVLQKKLQKLLQENIWQYCCTTANYPFCLPSNILLEEIRYSLEAFQLSLAKIYSSLYVDFEDVAKEILNLSNERYDLITTPTASDISDQDIADRYGLYSGENTEGLSSQTLFCKKAGLDANQLEELVLQNTRQSEVIIGKDVEISENLYLLFINKELDDLQYITLSKELLQITDGTSTPQSLDNATLDRLQRFIRLAQSLEWSFSDLDWTLCSLNASDMDTNSTDELAKIKKLQDTYGQSLEVLCALFSDIKTIGMGKSGRSQAMFDKIFNQPQFFYDQSQAPYHPSFPEGASNANSLYQDIPLNLDYKESSDENSQIISSLLGCLKLPSRDLALIIHHLVSNDGFSGVVETSIPLTVKNLSALYRYSQLPKILSLSIVDFLTWLKLIEIPVIQSLNDLVVVCLRSEWLKKSKLTASQIDYLINSVESSSDKNFVKDKLQHFLTNLQKSSQCCQLKPLSFVQSQISKAQSLLIFQTLVAVQVISEDGVVLIPHLTEQNKSYLQNLFLDINSNSVIEILNSTRNRQNSLIIQSLADLYQLSPQDMTAASAVMKKMYPAYANFNGTDAGFSVPYSTDLPSDTFSITGWFYLNKTKRYLNNVSSQQYIFSCRSGSSGYELYMDNDVITCEVGNFGSLSCGEWYHFAFAYDGEKIYLFINGDSRGNFADASFTSNKKPLTFGYDSSQGSYLNGKLSQIRMYSDCLDQDQVKQDMNSFDSPPTTDNLVAWWPLNEGFQQQDLRGNFYSIILDASDNNHNGRFVGTDDNIWNNCYLNQLLIQNNTSTQQFFLALNHSTAYVKWLNLTFTETMSFLDNPVPFAIDVFNPLTKLTLNNITAVVDFHHLVNSFDDTENALLQYLDSSQDATDNDQVKLLSQITHWDSKQIKLIEDAIDGNGNSIWPQDPSQYFNTINGLLSLTEVFGIANKLGVDIPFLLYLRALYNLSGDDWSTFQQAVQMVTQVTHANVDLKQTQNIQGSLAEKKRDLLCELLIWELGKTFSGINNQQDLYEFLLIDVQMASNVQISYLKQGLDALQLYINRIQNNLEAGVINNIPPVWWSWMSSYRVWQANREVYLNPENYVDPTLRQVQSPLFQDLSSKLLQNSLDEKTLIQIYADYLNGLSEIAHLRIVDSYCIDIPSFTGASANQVTKNLFLFGCTYSDPQTFYFRNGLIVNSTNESDEANISWTPWEQIPLSINSRYITPIYAFKKLFVFWVEQTQKNISSDGTSVSVTATTATIKYSCQKVSQGWSQPQTLASYVIKVTSNNETEMPGNVCLCGFDANSSYEDSEEWNKVRLFYLPATGVEVEQILVTLGNWVTQGTTALSSNTVGDSKEEIRFSDMLKRASTNAASINSSNTTGSSSNYTTVVPVVTLSASFVKEERVLNSSSTGDLWFLFSQKPTPLFSVNIEQVKNQCNWLVANTTKESFLLLMSSSFPQTQEALTLSYSNDQVVIELSFPNQQGTPSYQCIRLSTSVVENLQQLLFVGGIDNMLQLSSQLLPEYNFASYSYNNNLIKPPKKLMNFNGAYGLYFWELFFYIPWLIAKNLNAQQNFSLAQTWYKYIFNPTQIENLPEPPFPPYFDGNNYVEIPYNDKQSTEVFSISVWLYPTNKDENSDVYHCVYCSRSADSFSGFCVYYHINENNQAQMEFWLGSGTLWYSMVVNSVVPTQEWTLFTGVYDGESIYAYINGVQATVNGTDNNCWDMSNYEPLTSTHDTNFFIGCIDDQTNKFIGYITNVAIYNRVLKPTEIQQIYQTNELPMEDITGYWTPQDTVPPTIEHTVQSLDQTTFYDISETKNNGSCTNPNFVQDPNCLTFRPQFNGSNYIEIPYNDKQSTQAFSISLWFYPTGTDNSKNYCLYCSASENIGYALYYHDQSLVLAMGESAPTNSYFASDTSYISIPPNQWTFATITFSNSQANLYINGSLVGFENGNFMSDAYYQPLTAENDTNFLIGLDNPTYYDGYFVGYICGVALYSKALSPSEVKQAYQADPLKIVGLVGYWPLQGSTSNAIQVNQEQNLSSFQDYHFGTDNKCWQFAPFLPSLYQLKYMTLTDNVQLLTYEYDPFQPDAIAHLRPEAYQKTIVLDYVNNLINYGDALFTEDSWETLTEATLEYTLAKEIIGKLPPISVVDIESAVTYQDIDDALDPVPPFLIDLTSESVSTDYPNLPESWQGALQNWLSVNNAYFWVPGNRQVAIYQKTIADRLYKIHHGLNIQGQQEQPALFQPPINPESLVTSASSYGNFPSTSSESVSIPAYRFSYLIQQAKNIAAQASSFGNALLAALEKQDAEGLAQLNAANQTQIYSLMTQIKADQINQLQCTQQSLQASLSNAQLQQQTYSQWLEEGLSTEEKGSLGSLEAAMEFMAASNVISYIASPLYMIPNIFGLADGGMNYGGTIEAVGRAFAGTANLLSTSSQLFSTVGQFDRRDDDWNLQLQIATNSINEINAQLEANQYALEIVQQDYNVNQTQIQQSQSVQNYLTSKFTNQELYQWMAGQLSTLYNQAYQLACDLAVMAQNAYQYELSNTDKFINTSSWNSQYQGLLAADALSLSLDQLEQAYLQNHRRKLEIHKTVSLLQLDPQALLTLKCCGNCTFDLREIDFDLDFPGHYNRQIKSISISIPAIVGPYQNIHATLTQNYNKVLIKPSEIDVKSLLQEGTAQEGNTPQDASVRSNWNSNQGIAISKGVDDSGLFVLNFNDERYLPFEGTGAISCWTLDMPKASNQIDFESISDVIIDVSYTADDGGSTFRNTVIATNIGDEDNPVCPLQNYSGSKYLSLKQTFANAWHAFTTMPVNEVYNLNFALANKMFPPNITEMTLGNSGQVYLVPIFTEATIEQIKSGNISLPTITLNSNNWNSTNKTVAIGENASPPTKWEIQVSNLQQSLLIAQTDAINTELWQDIVLIIPYNGGLDWGSTNNGE